MSLTFAPAPPRTHTPTALRSGRFNAWTAFNSTVNESVMYAAIDAFVSLGLKDAGYAYVSLDDFWQGGRYPNGTIYWNNATFPRGIPALADYVSFGVFVAAFSSKDLITSG